MGRSSAWPSPGHARSKSRASVVVDNNDNGWQLEVAGTTYTKTLHGRAIKQPIGQSMMPILSGVRKGSHGNEGVGHELSEMKAYGWR